MMQSSVYGRLGNDPRQLKTKSDKTMASCSIAVNVTGNSETEETLQLKVLAFNRVADQLLKHSKGDLISVSGRIQQNRWVKDNEERVDLQIIVDTVVSAKTVRPGGGRKKKEPANSHTGESNNFHNDPLEF